MVEHGDVIRYPLDVGQLVRGEEDGPVGPAREEDHGLDQRPARYRVQADGRVIQDQQLGLRGERQRQAEAGPLAAGQALHPGGGPQAEVADDAAEDLLVPGGIEARLEIAAFPHAHPAIELVLFGQVADARPGLRRQRANVVAEDGAPTARGREQPQQHADGGGLAGAVAAQQREDPAARHLQVQFIHRRPRAEVARQTLGADHSLLIHC